MTTSAKLVSENDKSIWYVKERIISELMSPNLGEFLEYLKIDCKQRGKRFIGACPVHEGDNKTAFNIMPDGYAIKCVWNCYTHWCHKGGCSLSPLIQGIAKIRKNRHLSVVDAQKICCKFLKLEFEDLKVSPEDVNKCQFISDSTFYSSTNTQNAPLITRTQVRHSLEIPSQFYINRGYSKEILERYDIGLCTTPGKFMYNRIVAPLYDNNYKYMIGCLGRELNDNNSDMKWIANPGFNKASALFNFWHARDKIKNKGQAILVEGVGDVLRLEEAGIHNSLAIMGATLTDDQMVILERSGAFELVVLTDNDEAGKVCAATIKKRCGRLYSLKFPQISKKDVGEMTTAEIQKELGGLIDG